MTCEQCQQPFEAKRRTAKFCSERCKKRYQRRPDTPKPSAAPRAGQEQETDSDQEFSGLLVGLTASTVTKLDTAGSLDGPEGQAALILAARIQATSVLETGTSLAALVREFRATLADATKDQAPAADPVDELLKRRERKRTAG
jgi:hypothetical protein